MKAMKMMDWQEVTGWQRFIATSCFHMYSLIVSLSSEVNRRLMLRSGQGDDWAYVLMMHPHCTSFFLLSLNGPVELWFMTVKKKSYFKHSETNSFSFSNLSSHISENVPQRQTSFTTIVVLGAAGFVLNQVCVSKRYFEVFQLQTYPRTSELQKSHPRAIFTIWKSCLM